MRPIKFRVRNTYVNKFVEIDTHKVGYILTSKGIIMSTGWDDEDKPTYGIPNDKRGLTFEDAEKRYEEMQSQNIYLQFTGLLDRNGKEIYEGDIVIANAIDEICVVYYDENRACYSLRRNNGTFRDIQNIREVLGSIHENPELLSS